MEGIILFKQECSCTESDCIRGGEKKVSKKCIGCEYLSTIEPEIKVNIRDLF